MLYKRFRQDGSSAAWMAYRQARNRCIAATHTAKHAFFFAASDKPQLFRNKIKECTSLGKLRQASLFWPCSTPTLSKASASMINRSFSDRITSLKQQQPLINTAASSSASMVDVKATTSRAFEFKEISASEVRGLLSDMPSAGSAGIDAISASMLKFIPDELSLVLAKLFNMSVARCVFPTQ